MISAFFRFWLGFLPPRPRSQEMLSVDVTFPEVKWQPSEKPDLIGFVDDMPCWNTSGKDKGTSGCLVLGMRTMWDVATIQKSELMKNGRHNLTCFGLCHFSLVVTYIPAHGCSVINLGRNQPMRTFSCRTIAETGKAEMAARWDWPGELFQFPCRGQLTDPMLQPGFVCTFDIRGWDSWFLVFRFSQPLLHMFCLKKSWSTKTHKYHQVSFGVSFRSLACEAV